MIPGHNDNLSNISNSSNHQIKTKGWGIEPGWKFVTHDRESRFSPSDSTIVYPRRALELKRNSISMTTSPVVRNVEIKLVGPLRISHQTSRRSLSPLSSPTSSSSDDNNNNNHHHHPKVSMSTSLTSSLSSSSSSEDEPSTVAEVKSIIEQRRNGNSAKFRFGNRFSNGNELNRFEPSLERVVTMDYQPKPQKVIKPPVNRYSPPNAWNTDVKRVSPPSTVPLQATITARTALDHNYNNGSINNNNISSSSNNNKYNVEHPALTEEVVDLAPKSFGKNYPAPPPPPPSSFPTPPSPSFSTQSQQPQQQQQKQQQQPPPLLVRKPSIRNGFSSLNEQRKKSHHADHQKNLINISKFLSNSAKGKTRPSSPPPPPPSHSIHHPQQQQTEIVPPGVLKKPGADKGHRSLKKVAFLENAEFSRGLP